MNLFRGKAQCNTCHLDGTANSTTPITPADATDVAPLFTDFTSTNIGTPQNFALPFLYENHPDQFGYVANAAGLDSLDLGVGGFLANVSLAVTLGEKSGPGIGTGQNPKPGLGGTRTPIQWQSSGPNLSQRRPAAVSRFREGVRA